MSRCSIDGKVIGSLFVLDFLYISVLFGFVGTCFQLEARRKCVSERSKYRLNRIYF